MALPAVVFDDHDLWIPRGVHELRSFRAWSLGDDFPDTGRVDYLNGVVEVEMSPEEIQSHNLVKRDLSQVLTEWVVAGDRGEVFVDGARLVHPRADLSVEPDLFIVLWETLDSGQARLVETPNRTGAFLEVEGSPDLVVEVVSRSSVQKDTVRLPPLYAAAGVRELWIVDARSLDEDAVRLDLFSLKDGSYVPVEPDGEGFRASKVLGRTVRLTRSRSRVGTWRYRLEEG